MLTKPWHRRVFVAFATMLLLLNTAGEGFGYRPCPHHTGSPAHGEHGAPGGEHDHAGHGAAAEASRETGLFTYDECPCGTACQTAPGSGPALRPATVALVGVVNPTPAPEPIWGAESLPARHDPHFLPFPLGPPLAR